MPHYRHYLKIKGYSVKAESSHTTGLLLKMKLFCVAWLWIFLSVSSDQSFNGKYSLEDFGNGTFTVNIIDLQESDSGIYWCEVKRFVKDTYDKVILTVSKGKKTCLESYTMTPAAHSDSSSITASLTSRDSRPDALKLSTLVTVSAHSSIYVVGGLVIAATLFLVGLATVHQCRKRVDSSESCATATSVNRNNTCEEVEENSTEMKSTDETEGHSVSVYQTLNLRMVQSNEIYGNL
ncbi:uncharacterized protein LOC127162837 [Labeo rohita]|uniref:uncharacterized protein LOC127162837 n=1 Tax=Labeo rohita TaxID=84645 RepID=UPI0021E22A88|nr:uncharacterized protein LOC127162837 [Labeo rohita]